MSEHSTTQVSTTTMVDAALERIRGPLGAFVFALVGDPRQAHDIVQEVLAQAQRAAQNGNLPFAEGEGEDAILRWLLCRSYRRAVCVQRFEDRDVVRPVSPTPHLDRSYPLDPCADPLADPLAEARALRQALAALGPEDAACVLLSVGYGFTLAQIAAMLEVQPGVVKKRLAHAKLRLRDAYFAAGAMPQVTGR